MSTSNSKAAAPKKAAAAVAEETPEQPRKTYAVPETDLVLNLEPELGAEILFDIIESEASEGDVNSYIMNLRLLRSMVGQDQFIAIRHRIGKDPEKVMGLINDLLGLYGMSLGEPSASSGS